VSLTALELLARSQPCVGLKPSEHWVPPRAEVASDGSVDIASEEHKADFDQVTVTAGGNIVGNRPSSMMRRHAVREEEIFKAFDVNGDGVASAEEVKALFHQDQLPVPKDLADILRNMDGNHDGGITYVEFLDASKHAAAHKLKREKLHDEAEEAQNRHHRHHRHRSTLEHEANYLEAGDRNEASMQKEEALFEARKLGAELMIEEREKSAIAEAAPGDDDSWVTCGGHKAPTCQACVSTDSNGRTVFDHGSEWCHGDCVYHQKKCQKSGTVNNDGAAKGVARGYATTPLPDLLNPNMTQKDERTVDIAAEAAIKEENMEAASKAKQEEEEIKNKKFSWSKFWLITCITVSVILGICACVSVCALVVYYGMPTPSAKGDPEDDGSGEEGGPYKPLADVDEKASGAAVEAPADEEDEVQTF